MSSCGQIPSQDSLIKLRQRLEVYSEVLLDWQDAIDEATDQISHLTPLEAEAASDEIEQIRNSHCELKQLRQQVDDGWALYRKLSENAEISKYINFVIPEVALPASLH